MPSALATGTSTSRVPARAGGVRDRFYADIVRNAAQSEHDVAEDFAGIEELVAIGGSR